MDLSLILPPRRHVIIVSDAEHGTPCVDPRRGENFFEKLGHPETQKQMSTPDEDFVFMCGARTFIASGGGFSKLVSSVVRLRGGNAMTRLMT